MSAIKRFFEKRSTRTSEVNYSAHSSMVKSPPPGRVTNRDDPNHDVWKPQESKGDQTEEARIPFFNSGFAVCPDCGERNIWRFEAKAGVMANGDTYGTEIFRCQSMGCGWKTSFLYNDGSVDAKYYETTHWPKGVHYFPESFMRLWVDKHELGSNIKHQFFLKQLTGNMLVDMEAANNIEEGIGVSKKEAEKISKAFNKPWTAVLTRQATKKTDKPKHKKK